MPACQVDGWQQAKSGILGPNNGACVGQRAACQPYNFFPKSEPAFVIQEHTEVHAFMTRTCQSGLVMPIRAFDAVLNDSIKIAGRVTLRNRVINTNESPNTPSLLRQ